MKELAPPPGLRDEIARRLRRDGLLQRRRVWPWAVAATVLIAFLLRPQKPPQANYILLLYETSSVNTGNRAEYTAWAQNMRPLIVGGEELDNNTLLTLNEAASSPRLAGFFLIHAKDDATAQRVARECPHVKHGGGVTLRRIVL